MAIELPELPYALNALEPYISTETLEYHYGKHHKTYVDNLNKLILNTPLAKQNLEQIIKNSFNNSSSIFNNAAQVFNHNFYWASLTPNSQTNKHNTNKPTSILLTAIEKTFGSFQDFKDKFSQVAFNTFGSGWAWLVKHNNSHHLEIISTSNANTPISNHMHPILTCDVWEHAYYIDYRNARAKYLEAFWHIVNWDFAEKNFADK